MRSRARLGLVGGDHGHVDGDGAIALDAAAALGEDRSQAASALVQPLGAHEGVAQVVGTQCRKLGLGRHHRGVEAGQLVLRGALVGGERGARLGARLQALAQRGELAAGDEQADGGELGDQRAVAACRVGLALERPQLAAHLAQQVGEAEQVALGRLEPALGLLLALAVLEDAGRLLDDRPAVLGAGVEHRRRAGPGRRSRAAGGRRPESDSRSCTSSRRHGTPLIAYSLSPLRNSVRLIDTSAKSIGSMPEVLSIVSVTSARPSAARLAVPAKMTSSIFPERTVRGPWAPSTQATASTMLDLPAPFGPTTTVTPGSRSSVVVSANDLNPLRVRVFRCIGFEGKRSVLDTRGRFGRCRFMGGF